MAPPIPIPCVDEDKEDSDTGIEDTLAPRKTTLRPTPSNRIPSPFRDRNEVVKKNRSSVLVCPIMLALESQSRLRISRQGILHSSQSRDGNESPTNKFSRLEKKYEELLPSNTYGRAISSNHDCSKPRNKKFQERISDDTYSQNSMVTELEEIPSHSSPATTNGGTVERTFDRAQSAGLDGDLPCRNQPIKSAKIARSNIADLLFIRIPTPLQTQITASKQKPLTLTDTNHITQNNTANSSSTKTGNQKNNSSMAVLQCSNAIANSSTTESSPSSTSSAKGSPSKASSSENMDAAGSVVENAQSHIQSEKDKVSTSLTPKAICKTQSPALTSKTIRKNLFLRETLIAEKESDKGKVSQRLVEETKDTTTGVKSEACTIVKERLEISQKPETSAMSIIKNSVVRQALSSVSATSFPGIQVKSVSTVASHVNKNAISGQSTPATVTTTKKKKTSPGSKRKRSGSNGSSTSQKPKGQSSGRWTQEEHQAFLEGLTECGREWKKVALRIPTRTSAQIRSHAQKYFAKLQRDQESSATNVNVGYVHADMSTPLTPAGPGLVVGAGGLSGTIIMSPGATPLAPSVRRNVERIMSNPRAAQREVEDTMEALRERYRQLQQRLEERRRNREEHKKNREQKQQQLSSASTNTGASSDFSTIASPRSLLHKPKFLNSVSRKRLHLPINQQKENIKKLDASGRSTSSPTGDDGSSVSSNVSSIAASRTDLGNEEIIALQVLGDALPRGDSANDLHVMGAEVLQGRGDSSIEADGTMPSIDDNISSSSYAQLAPLPGVANDNDSMMNQGDSITEKEINFQRR